MWEQSLLAIQAPRFMEDRVAFIGGKPCSHSSCSHRSQNAAPIGLCDDLANREQQQEMRGI